MFADPELSAFVRQHIRSVWALELLLQLRSDPARVWRKEDLVAQLRATAGIVEDNLARFERSELVVLEGPDTYRYAPASAVLVDLCAKLDRAYRERPVAVINLISRPPDSIQSLADAFKFRGDDA